MDLQPGITVFTGRNGYGKTNIVEAVGYLATLSSHRVSSDAPLVRAGTNSARISATAINDGRELTAHLLVKAQGANLAQINRTRLNSPRELLGTVRSVLFAPEDLELVKGDPAGRRRFLDDLSALRRPYLAGARLEYERILRQRNALLKGAGSALRRGYDSAEGQAALATLDSWDEQLARVGAKIMVARADLVAALQPLVAGAYATLAPASRPASIAYRPQLDGMAVDQQTSPADREAEVEALLLMSLSQLRQKEIDRGMSLVGPHRDDLDLILGNTPAKGFASHGETWSFALSLRLAAYQLLKDEGPEPILILDDVFSELDRARREALIKIAVEAEQVLITSAVGEELPEALREAAATVGVDTHVVTVRDTDSGRISVLDDENRVADQDARDE